MTAFDTRACRLGEGPLWHPERCQLFWFDVISHRLLTQDAGGPQSWQFDEYVSAAGWVDRDTLLMASATGLWRFDVNTGARDLVHPLEDDNPVTRSNDGRADPWGGFWIGTMGINAEPDAGSIYRFYRGELRRLYASISVSNSICFSPDRRFAYHSDTDRQLVMRQTLDPADGWPTGEPEVWLDLHDAGLFPDGAVVDAAGNLWMAQWGAARVAVYAPDGAFVKAVELPAERTTCPAFGGPDFTTLYVTSATVGLGEDRIAAEPLQGTTFAIPDLGPGLPEHRVIL